MVQRELIDNNKIKYYKGYIYLNKYTGKHPEVLKDYPLRNIEDIRKL